MSKNGLSELFKRLEKTLSGQAPKSDEIPDLEETFGPLAEVLKEALKDRFPNPNELPEGHIFAGFSFPCPSEKNHDHLTLHLNDNFREKPVFPSTSNEDVEIFTTQQDIEAFLEKAKETGELTRFGEEQERQMIAPGVVGIKTEVNIIQLPNDTFMLVKNKDKEQIIQDGMNGTPKIHTAISNDYDSSESFLWIDRIAVLLAARDGYKGQTLGFDPNINALCFSQDSTTDSYSTWRHLAIDAINVQKFAQILIEKPETPISAIDALDAISALHTVGFSIGTPEFSIQEDDKKGTDTVTIKHPLTNMVLEISAEDLEEGFASFSTTYKNEQNQNISIKNKPLNSTTFLSNIVRPITEQMQKEFPEIVKVNYLIDISKQSAPCSDENKFQQLDRLTNASCSNINYADFHL